MRFVKTPHRKRFAPTGAGAARGWELHATAALQPASTIRAPTCAVTSSGGRGQRRVGDLGAVVDADGADRARTGPRRIEHLVDEEHRRRGLAVGAGDADERGVLREG